MIITCFRYKKPDVSIVLGGLVDIKAGCAAVSMTEAIFIYMLFVELNFLAGILIFTDVPLPYLLVYFNP